MKATTITEFDFYHDGTNRTVYPVGSQVEGEAAEIAVREGWAKWDGQKAAGPAARNKARGRAPRNKSAGR